MERPGWSADRKSWPPHLQASGKLAADLMLWFPRYLQPRAVAIPNRRFYGPYVAWRQTAEESRRHTHPHPRRSGLQDLVPLRPSAAERACPASGQALRSERNLGQPSPSAENMRLPACEGRPPQKQLEASAMPTVNYDSPQPARLKRETSGQRRCAFGTLKSPSGPADAQG